MKTLSILLLVLSFTLSACATLATSSKQNVSFTSDPNGAVVRVDGEIRGVTPTSLILNRRGTRYIAFEFVEQDGLNAELGSHNSSLWPLANLLVLNVPGLIIDVANRSGSKLDADSVHAELATGVVSVFNRN